jgi:hypothetical protein
MIRAPWWTWLLACGIGALGTALWLRAGSDTGLDELRASVDREGARADSIAQVAAAHAQRADSATEAHAALAAATDSTIARLTARVQATTARAADLGDQLRAVLDEDGSAVLAELEAEWRAALDAERAQASVWQARALSAEAGWADERLARVAAQEEAVVLRSQIEAQAGLVRALEAQVARGNRDRRILFALGAGLLVREVVR